MAKKKIKINFYEKDESSEVAGRLGRIYGLAGEAVDQLQSLIEAHLQRVGGQSSPKRDTGVSAFRLGGEREIEVFSSNKKMMG